MPDPVQPSFQTLKVSTDGRLGRLTLSQPDRLNPIGSVALQELAAAARWFNETEASVVIVTGEGRAFSAGFDLREFTRDAGRGPAVEEPEPAASTPLLGAAMAEAISTMEAITIAAVQGPCVGGGFVLALCCDLRVASDEAWFSLPETELGIPLAWGGVPRLVREIGSVRTTELVLSCRRLPAVEASSWGLLNQVVSSTELVGAVDDLASLLLTRRREVVTATKHQVRAAAEALVPTDGSWAGTDLLISALQSLRL